MEFLIAAMLFYLIYRVVLIDARIAKLSQPPIRVVAPKEPESRVNTPYEKPVVPGAKPVKAVQIGDGKLNFDEQNQVAEWI
mgnify:CR=1 FL=1